MAVVAAARAAGCRRAHPPYPDDHAAAPCRAGKRLIGGEESELFERIRREGMACYYVPRAVMYHIIPDEKLTPDYFDRLAYNVGVSQRRRAELHGSIFGLYVREAAK